jgi:hypothetical protein
MQERTSAPNLNDTDNVSIHLENVDSISYASNIYCILNIRMNYSSIVNAAFLSSSLTQLEKPFFTSHRPFLPLWEVFKHTCPFVNSLLVTVMISNGALRSQFFTESWYTISSHHPILFVRLHCILPAFENIRIFNWRCYLMFRVFYSRYFPLCQHTLSLARVVLFRL